MGRMVFRGVDVVCGLYRPSPNPNPNLQISLLRQGLACQPGQERMVGMRYAAVWLGDKRSGSQTPNVGGRYRCRWSVN